MATKIELLIAGTWIDITEAAQVLDNPYSINEGRSDGSGSSQPSTLNLKLNSPDGLFFPHNPASPYYKKIGRNTRIRLTEEGQAQFFGEVSSWKPTWDQTNKIKKVEVQAAGILRRIGQGSQPVFSGYKSFLSNTSPVTYWALDDPEGATAGSPTKGTYKLSSFRNDGGTAVITFGVGTLASHLAPTLRINDLSPAAGGDRMIGYCRGSDTTPDALAFDMLWKVDTEIIPGGTLTAYPTGNFHLHLYENDGFSGGDWDISFRHDGVNDDIQFQISDISGTTVLGNTAILSAVRDTTVHHIRLQLTQNGANVDYAIYIDGTSVLSGTYNSYTLHRSDALSVEYDRNSNVNDGLLAIGHVIVWENAANIPAIATTYLASLGFNAERAGRRIERLCGATDTPFVSIGNLDLTEPMGLQYEDQFSGQLDECEQTDQGLLYEPRDQLAVGYRTRISLYAQTPAVVLSYANGELFPPLEPIEDDQTTRNDIFVQRREGGSFNVTQETGPLNVQDPEDDPDGVGRYKDEYQVNTQTDARLEGIANWRLAIGTIDDARYPQVTVNLAAPDVARNSALKTALLTARIGDRLVIKNAQAANIYADIDLLILGSTRTKNALDHLITFNCVPYAPYDVGVWDSGQRYDTAGSELQTGIDTTQNTLSVVATGGTLWSTTASGYDINVGGERMTVLSCSGASSPQSMVVQRSVNSLVKSHLAGTPVKLWSPARYAL